MKKNCTLLILLCLSISMFAQNNSYLRASVKNLNVAEYKESKLGPALSSIASGKQEYNKQEQNKLKHYSVSKGRIFITAFSNTTINDLAKALKTTLNCNATKITGNNQLITSISISDVSKLSTIASLKYAFAEMAPITHGNHNNSQTVLEKLNAAAYFNGAVTSQGDAAIQGDVLRNTYNVDGTGLKIGIMSNSYNQLGGAAASVIAGDLPGAGNPNGFTQDVVVVQELATPITAAIDEGRAMAEIVHDIAPGAEILYRTAFNTHDDFAIGILELANLGCDIIVDDISYFEEPYFQDGLIAQAVDQVTANGVLYFTAAGNSAAQSFESLFVDSSIDLPGIIGSVHNFGAIGANLNVGVDGVNVVVSSLEINPVPGTNVALRMQWDDPSIRANPNGPFPDTDMTISVFTLVDNFIELEAISNINSVTSGRPFDAVGFTADVDANVPYFVVVSSALGTIPGAFKFIATNNVSFLGNNNSGTAVGHANAAGALTAGAVRYDNTPAFGGTPVRQNSSSTGGIPIFLDINGNPIPLELRSKPDFMAPDGANTTFFGATGAGDIENDGFPNFSGTSAAAPHAAAAAALMLEAAQSQGFTFTKDQFLDAVIETSLDMTTTVGYDIFTGHGLMLGDALFKSLLNTLSTDDFSIQNTNIKIFPNPLVDNMITVSGLDQSGDVAISIYNIIGQEVYSFSEEKSSIQSSLRINVPNLTSGTYIVKVNNNLVTTTHKLIVR